MDNNSEIHYLLKGLPECDRFTFYSSGYFYLNELNKQVTLNEMSKEDIINLIRNDLFKVKTKLNAIMINGYDGFCEKPKSV